ncbi:hypothetical protein OESDEN_12701 [Oesophagostomum dentatum]|uniref:Uncharacterized protein n=1 Tax=Oesophagostomum dentatum TaxID=61180 RepID=A0A0B1SQB8_OESDE|nr:hypothetical protein OESDEN_12701 [Oesophagostomum dentatum]
MDLIDLYHVHDHHVAFPDDDFFDEKLMQNEVESPKESTKMKKPRFVPWEPYKAAPSADRKGEAPQELPKLIPYGGGLVDENSNKHISEANLLVDARRFRAKLNEDCESEQVLELKKQIDEVKSQLELERKLNAELKRLMVATISDELQGQVQALTEDKIRLAHRVQEFSEKLCHEDEQLDQLKIDRDVWKCKFLAQSIRTDELSYRAEVLIGMLREAQRIVKNAWYVNFTYLYFSAHC